MKYHLFPLIKRVCFAAALLPFVACGDDDGGDVPESKDHLSVSVTEMTFQSEPDSKSFTIMADCAWTVAETADWLSVVPKSGSGNGEVSVSVSRNTTSAERSAVITVSGGSAPDCRINVVQSKPDGNSQLPSSDDNQSPTTTR